MFPLQLSLQVNGLVDGEWVFSWPLRYTVRNGRHFGLLKRSAFANGRCSMRAHFLEYGGAIANAVFKHFENNDAPITLDIRGVDKVNYFLGATVSIATWNNLQRKYGSRSYYILQNKYAKTLLWTVAVAASHQLNNLGYSPKKRPRKRLGKNTLVWRNYKGLEIAVVSNITANISIDESYEGSLLDIGVLPEVMKYVNKRSDKLVQVNWYLNTPQQALEAQLLCAKTDYILVRGTGEVLLT